MYVLVNGEQTHPVTLQLNVHTISIITHTFLFYYPHILITYIFNFRTDVSNVVFLSHSHGLQAVINSVVLVPQKSGQCVYVA